MTTAPPSDQNHRSTVEHARTSGLRRYCVALLLVCLSGSLAAATIGSSLNATPQTQLTPQTSHRHYQQSPRTAAAEAAGELPPLHERLPRRPFVVQPLERAGDYGGTARIFHLDISMFINMESPITMAPDIATLLPNLAESWSWNEDRTELTITLRQGLRWSDGHPFGADDFMFRHYDLTRNSEFAPVVVPPFGKTEIIKLAPHIFRYEFPEPYPLFENTLAQLGDYFYAPKHFLSQFHPSYVDREVLEQQVSETGYISWMALLQAKMTDQSVAGPYAPTMESHYLVRRTPTQISFERNPYYHKVDDQGRQLPYIDAVAAEVTESLEVMTAKAATGQKDFAGYSLNTQDFPLFKLGERTSGIRTLQWNRIHGSDVIIRPNFNIADPKLRALYWDIRFRRALSIGINRAEMNEIIYFGRGTPRQVTVLPTSSYFEPEFATANAEFDPERARALLAEIGLRDVNGDKLVEYADGTPLTISVEFLEIETPKGISMELVASYWREIGLDVRLKLVDRALQDARSRAGLMQMSVWHADRSTDMLFPVQPSWYAPIRTGWEGPQWNDWTRWYLTQGRLGVEPPPEIKALQDAYDDMRETPSVARRVELGKQILRSTAENIWSIGTVGLAPHPVVINGRLRNVPEVGWWGWDTRWTLPYHPASWFFDGGERVGPPSGN